MSCIVCATRGGEGSRAVQSEAIRLARETGHPLIFLYVMDINGLGQLDPVMVDPVRAELTWLGKALVNAARQRAWVQNITAKVVIREGDVEEEICRFLMEENASQLLLGAPRGTTPFFGDDAVEQFASAITRDTGVPVQVIRPESVDIHAHQRLFSPTGAQSNETTAGDPLSTLRSKE